MAKAFKITPDGLKKLEDELEHLKTVGRADIAEKIKVARSYGDLSENSEYDDAKNEQAILEARIATIEATLKVAGGQMHIVVENNSEQNKYIQRVWLNGEPYDKGWISHSDIKAGSELKFEMGSTPNLWYTAE